MSDHWPLVVQFDFTNRFENYTFYYDIEDDDRKDDEDDEVNDDNDNEFYD